MNFLPPPPPAVRALLDDAARRDLPTARRAALLDILASERYLTREQLIARVEAALGPGCFGSKAFEDVLYRDLRAVKAAFASAGLHLKYSRAADRPGYYLAGQPPISPDLAAMLRGALRELDPRQLAIFARMTPAERFQLGCSVTDAGRRAVELRRLVRQKGEAR